MCQQFSEALVASTAHDGWTEPNEEFDFHNSVFYLPFLPDELIKDDALAPRRRHRDRDQFHDCRPCDAVQCSLRRTGSPFFVGAKTIQHPVSGSGAVQRFSYGWKM